MATPYAKQLELLGKHSLSFLRYAALPDLDCTAPHLCRAVLDRAVTEVAIESGWVGRLSALLACFSRPQYLGESIA